MSVAISAGNPQAWDAAKIDDRSAWSHPLPQGLLSSLRTCIRAGEAITDLRLDEKDREAWSGHFAAARDELETGRGFVIFDRLPVEQLSPREATGLYWLISQFLGEPFAQNVQGTLLYDVRDTGQDPASGARFSVTNYESSFHTDNSFGDSILDYVGLLCLHTAQSGGLSQNISGYAAIEVLRREHADILEVLARDFQVDRRGGVREGESGTVSRPVLTWNGPELIVRYLRYWIEAGHEKAGQPLTVAQRAALDEFDRVLNRPQLRVEFSLRPGEMYFINNRWILHNRTAFTDHPVPERRRHLVRVWLRARGAHAERG